MTSHLTLNNYADTPVQTGRMPGFSECVEYIQATFSQQLIREAKINKMDLAVVWLNLATVNVELTSHKMTVYM